jgi:hypothetical protein
MEKKMSKEAFEDEKVQLTEKQGSKSTGGQKSKVSKWATVSLWCAIFGLLSV